MDQTTISKYQLIVLMMGFIYGQIQYPAAAAGREAWLAFLISWAGGFIILSVYIIISRLHPEKTLIQILELNLGKYPGKVIGLLYIFYFIHLTAILYRAFGEFINLAIYPETPAVAIHLAAAIVIIYSVRSGLEVAGRVSELIVPFLILSLVITTLVVLPRAKFEVLFPFLEFGWQPVLEAGFNGFAFPFGELVLFLLIFPQLNKKAHLLKTSFTAVAVMGLGLFILIIRDLLVIGPLMIKRVLYPSVETINIFPAVSLSAFLFLQFLIGGGIKITVCTYASALGISQIFKLKNYKPFVIPVTILAITISEWLYDNVLETVEWSSEIYSYYALPFQVIIPIILLVVSIIRRMLNKKLKE